MAVKKSKAKSKAATKKTAAKSVAKKTLASKATVKKSSRKKTVASKTAATAKGKTKTTAKPTAAKPRSKASSVDGILKRFQKERVTKDSKLVSIRSQIKDLNSKIQAYQKQVVKLKAEQLDTENSICTLDIRRDQEVAGLLSSLGINLDSIASLGDSVKKKVDKPTPLFDAAQPADDNAAGDDVSEEISDAEIKRRATKKPKVDILIAGQE